MKYRLNAQLVALCSATCVTAPAFGQSSVTLYGAVDDMLIYQSSQTALGSTSGGRSNVKLGSGVWLGNRFGLKGTDDLGGGTKTVFQLESGFNLNNGAQQYTNALFGRQAWVGVTNSSYGTVTFGRQYTSYYTLLSPYGPTTWITGYFGAHPGDIDSLDNIYRGNNSVVYASPRIFGFTVSGSYSLAGVPGSFYQGSTWSGAIQYVNGPVGLAVGILRINNSTPGGGTWGADSTANSGGEPGISSLTNGYQTAQSQQRIAITGGYAFTSLLDISASYSNVQYRPGVNSLFSDTAIFNTVGTVLHWKPVAALDLGLGYSYTRATKANGIADAAQYHQVVFAEYYSLSKRTGLYAIQGFTRSSGRTLGAKGMVDIIDATPTVGDGFSATPSSSRGVFVAGVGITHRF